MFIAVVVAAEHDRVVVFVVVILVDGVVGVVVAADAADASLHNK